MSDIPSSELTFFLIAGESSGDILGARLMRALRRKLDGKVIFKGVGGPLMQAEGLDLLFPHTELMHFGVIEVLRHIPRLLARINQTVDAITELQPDALITIDAPDFCFRVAKKVRKRSEARGQRSSKKDSFWPLASSLRHLLIHYVAPTVWAWRPGRTKKIAQYLDHLLVVLPFEPPYFTREGLDCTFVGHSVVEGDAASGSNAAFRSRHNIDPDTVLMTVLPGSRTSEISRLLPIFHETLDILRVKYPKLQIVVPTVPHLKTRIAEEISSWGIKAHIVEGDRDKYDGFAASRAALTCSGTVALELALAHLPSIICYKINGLTALLYRRFIRVPYVNLINLMNNKRVVPELLQENCTAEKLANEMDILLSDETARQKQIADLTATAAWLGQGQFVPSERAADTVLAALKKDRAPAVLQVLPALVTGGVERGTVETTAALVAAGFRAYVASAGGPMVAEIEKAGGVHVALPLASKNPFTMWRNIGRLVPLIRQHKIDIVHARSRAPAWSASRAAKVAGVPFVTTFHSAYGAGSKLKRLYNSVMATGERVIAISNFVADYAERTYGVSREIMRVIPRGVDIATFDRSLVSAERIDAVRRAWNLTATTPVILMPGRLTRWKGQSVLIQALARLARRDFVCVIVGGGKDSRYGHELLAEIKQAGMEQNIALLDTCRDMAAAYCLADIVVVPSTRPEGFGRVVIEAQAMGTAVIASNHGGARETVIDGKTGFLTKPGDSDDLACAIDKVLNLSPDDRAALASRAISHIRTNFTTASMTAKTLAVYREVLRKE